MRYKVVLEFMIDGTEGEAWEISEALERAAIKKNYLQVSSWVESSDRGGLLGTEEQPITSSASSCERVTPRISAPSAPEIGTAWKCR